MASLFLEFSQLSEYVSQPVELVIHICLDPLREGFRKNVKNYGLLPNPPRGRYDFGFSWNLNTGKQILLCVMETRRYGYILGSGGRL